MNDKITELVLGLREEIEKLSDDERVEVLDTLFAGYCKHCGSATLPCYCERDD